MDQSQSRFGMLQHYCCFSIKIILIIIINHYGTGLLRSFLLLNVQVSLDKGDATNCFVK